MTSMRVAVCQLRSEDDVDANLEVARGLVGEAADGGADLAALPEYLDFMGPSSGRSGAARLVPGDTVDRLTEVARERSIWVLAGSVLEADGGHVFDTSTLIDRAGEVVAEIREQTGRVVETLAAPVDGVVAIHLTYGYATAGSAVTVAFEPA